MQLAASLKSLEAVADEMKRPPPATSGGMRRGWVFPEARRWAEGDEMTGEPHSPRFLTSNNQRVPPFCIDELTGSQPARWPRLWLVRAAAAKVPAPAGCIHDLPEQTKRRSSSGCAREPT